MDLKQAGGHRKRQILKLEEWRDKAYRNASIYKERTKWWHDKRLKPKVFNLGDKVLLFNSRVKLFGHGKLRSKWLGPYLVVNVSSHGAITIQDDDGNTDKVNDHRVKLFLNHNKALAEEIDVINIINDNYMLN
jgi:hypothetical protein